MTYDEAVTEMDRLSTEDPCVDVIARFDAEESDWIWHNPYTVKVLSEEDRTATDWEVVDRAFMQKNYPEDLERFDDNQKRTKEAFVGRVLGSGCTIIKEHGLIPGVSVLVVRQANPLAN